MLLALCAALPGVALQVWNELDLREARNKAVREQVLLAAQGQLSELDRVAEGSEGVLVALAQIPQIRNPDAAGCNSLLVRIRDRYQAYRALIVADSAGNVACSSIGPGPGISDRLYFKRAIESGAFSTGEFVDGRGTRAPGFHFSFPLRNEDGAIIGVIAAALDLDWMANRLAQRLPADSSVILADANRTLVIALPNKEQQGRPLPTALVPAFRSTMPNVLDVDLDARSSIVAFVPLGSSKTGLFVAVSRERAAVFADLRRVTIRASALIIFGLFLSLLVTYLWGTYGIRAPIARLLTLAENWREGRHAPSGVKWGSSEFGRLGKSLDELAQTVADREQRARNSQLRLQEREAYLSTVLDRVPVGIMQTDPQKRYVFVNRHFCQMIQRSPEELIGRSFLELTHQDDAAKNDSMFRHALGSGEPYSLRKRYLLPDGEFIWIEVTVAPIGAPSRDLLAVAVDLTERIATEEQQELLIHELNHRVKNTLAAVQSLALMTTRYTASKEEFYEAFSDRLLGLSATHNLLTSGLWRGASLRDLIHAELRPYAHEGSTRTELIGEPVELSPNQAINLGLMLHELATNAAKHGALSTASGEVRVTWCASGRALRIRWEETGGPAPALEKKLGFGSRLIAQTARALGGEVASVFEPGGFRCEVRIPRFASET